MFYYLSKTVWFLATPSNLILTLILAGLVLLVFRRRRAGTLLLALGGLSLLTFGLSPLPRLLLRVLENRFPVVMPASLGRVDGIIVLGGGGRQVRDQIKFTDAAARVTQGAALARAFPGARLLFSGGEGRMIRIDGDDGEAGATVEVFRSLGVPDAQVSYESESRNTRENALFAKKLAAPRPGERWVLVTSAFHMPRSVGSFRQAGFDVVPFPVDFHTRDRPGDWAPFGAVSEGLRLTDIGIREWIGLAAYRIAGYTRRFLPAPAPDE